MPQDGSLYIKTQKGDIWGGEGVYCWFKGKAQIPEEYIGKNIYIKPEVGGFEGMLWVNGRPTGTFTTKMSQSAYGKHYCDLLMKNATVDNVNIAIEFYAGHYIIGTQPYQLLISDIPTKP